MSADLTTTSIPAESAPIGVQLWPTTAPEYARNFTLAEVQIVRNAYGSFVRWVYESGTTRHFEIGMQVACRLADAEADA